MSSTAIAGEPAMKIPQAMLKQLYTRGSLKKTESGFLFSLKNRINSAKFIQLVGLSINGKQIDFSNIRLVFNEDKAISIDCEGKTEGVEFPLGAVLTLYINEQLNEDTDILDFSVSIMVKPFGQIELVLQDTIKSQDNAPNEIPRNRQNDFHPEIIEKRRKYISEMCGVSPQKLFDENADLTSLPGNIEHFCGMAQVPVGLAGPIHVHGEHAEGEFLVPLATTEGTLVASYNRGMKLLNMSGGIKATILNDAMQRAPVFVFEDARHARDFGHWVKNNIEKIRQVSQKTDAFAKLRNIEVYNANKFAFLRFNYTTGDAGGQNMVGRATHFACAWILENYSGVKNFFLEANMATDKKSSFINILNTRGKRVVAEATIKRQHLIDVMRVEPEQIATHQRVATVGSFLSGVNNNGLHAANGITAMFIACGQDVANVSESSAGILYAEVTAQGDLYLSLTLPSLIVATCGGGTGLGTQRECLEMLGCYGPGGVMKFAEIVTSVALAGEISLACAISSLDWVTSHEELGRN